MGHQRTKEKVVEYVTSRTCVIKDIGSGFASQVCTANMNRCQKRDLENVFQQVRVELNPIKNSIYFSLRNIFFISIDYDYS